MDSTKLRIAVVGSGVSGLTVARLLSTSHSVTLFEASDRLGGHAQTLTVEAEGGGKMLVDAGVCMFQSTGYPNFFKLMKSLGIQPEPSPVDLELYSIPTDKRYFLDLNSPWKTMFDSLLSSEQRWLAQDGFRFYKAVRRSLSLKFDVAETLGEHLNSQNYSEAFRVLISFYTGATWTINQKGLEEMPLAFVAKTMWELGFLPRIGHGRWFHIKGSVDRYIQAMASAVSEKILLNARVEVVERVGTKVYIRALGAEHEFDHVVFAIPPYIAIQLIANPTDEEFEVLGKFRGSAQSVSFTADDSLVRKWTVRSPVIFAATDVINRQDEAGREFLFRVGFADIKQMCNYAMAGPLYMWYDFPNCPLPEKKLGQVSFSTPTFTKEIVLAQRRHLEVSGRNRLHFCGSSWTNGIHEGAVTSALNVANWFGCTIENSI